MTSALVAIQDWLKTRIVNRHAKWGTATEHAKKRNASSSASKGGGKCDRRVKAKVEAHDDDSQGYGDRVVKPSSTPHPHSRTKVCKKPFL